MNTRNGNQMEQKQQQKYMNTVEIFAGFANEYSHLTYIITQCRSK